MTISPTSENRSLYICGGISALIVVLLWITQLLAVTFMGTPPGNAIEWFRMFNHYGPQGLINSFFLDSIAFIIMVFVFIPIYFSLRSYSPSAMLMATVIKLIAIILGIVTNVSLTMYSLSNQYSLSVTEEQKSQIISSAQTILLHNQDGTASAFTLILGSIAGLIISFVMFRERIFGKFTAIVGVLANICQLLEPPSAFAPIGFYSGMGIGVLIIFISFILFVIWYIQISRALFRLSQ